MRGWREWRVWRRWGFLVFFLVMLGLKVASAAAHSIWGELRSGRARTDVIAIGLFLGAAFVLVLDLGLRPVGRSDAAAGQPPGGEGSPAPAHEFLMLPVEVWPHLLTAAGLAMLFRR